MKRSKPATEGALALLALVLQGCADEHSYACLAPVNLNLSAPLESYDFGVTGRLEDGTLYANSANCPGTFSGGSCDERGISFRTIDNIDLILQLTLRVDSQVIFDEELTVDALSAAQCEGGSTREVEVAP